MNPILDAGLVGRLNAGLEAARPTGNRELGQEDFFRLMIAQLENQDPNDPVDPQAQLAQLAQFSTVDGIHGLQASFDSLAGSLQSMQALQASSLVGRSVLVDSRQGSLGASGGLRGQVALADPVNGLEVRITGASGRLVRTLELGSQGPGVVGFEWDGLDGQGNRMPPGAYELHVQGAAGAAVESLVPQVQAEVESVTIDPQGTGVTVNLPVIGGVALGDIRAIL